MMKRRTTQSWSVASGACVTLLCVLVILVPRFVAFEQTGSPTPLVIYFDDGPLISEKLIRNGGPYLPVIDLVERLSLSYTEAPATPSLSIRGPGGTVDVRHNSNSISIDGGEIQMNWPAFRENGRWWVPMEFLTKGVTEATGIRFRYGDDTNRVIAGDQEAVILDMNATRTEVGTRLTIRSESRINIQVQEDPNRNRVVLAIDRGPFAPTRETIEYRDSTVNSVAFDDSDGNSKIVVGTTSQAVNVTLLPADDNRTFYVDFVPDGRPERAATVVALPTRDQRGSREQVRVIVIDAGHGGLDSGTSAHGMLEKDLTMVLARKLRTGLQSRFDATVILTRDTDREMSIEERASIANNSQANLFISLHVGYSLDATESDASLFVMQPITRPPALAPLSGNLFQPWYHAYMNSSEGSLQLAESLQENLDRAIPAWEFSLRQVPLGLLASTSMPAVVLELGNANNEQDLNNLSDTNFQNRVVDALLDAIEAYQSGA
jgi:N-acetylmuramoyl-L-alanine amidase